MALNSLIPKASKLAITGGVFTSRFSVPTIGKYDFTNYAPGGGRINCSVDMGLEMRPNYVYFFHEMNFSLSIDDGDFLSSINSGSVPQLSVRDSQSRKCIFNAPFRMFRYFENSAIDAYYYNLNANNFLMADFQCVLNQTANLVGIDYIYAQVSMSIYEITEAKFIKDFKQEKI